MERKSYLPFLRHLPTFTAAVIIAVSLIIYPTEIALGIKSGIALLGGNTIPSLFPFMVISTYISQCPFTEFLAGVIEKGALKIFKTNGYGVMAVILGLLGGYPIGAKTVSEFYENGKITKNEAERLFIWCINPGPAFVITAVGSFMLSSFKTGIILYSATLLSTLTMGFIMRFLSDNEKIENKQKIQKSTSGAFVNSVATGGEAMLGVCGWVLTFSGISALSDIYVTSPKASLFIKAVFEVTTGCVSAADNHLSLPLISAILGFGGLAVIFQVGKYMYICGVQLKRLICARIVDGALNAFFCSQLIRFFPQSISAFSPITFQTKTLTISHSLTTSFILIIMCIVLIFEVDNKKKMC